MGFHFIFCVFAKVVGEISKLKIDFINFPGAYFCLVFHFALLTLFCFGFEIICVGICLTAFAGLLFPE